MEVLIFEEIKKSRGKSSATTSSRIDEEVGAANIANHFAEIYTKLYNKVELGDKIAAISDDIEADIDSHSQSQVEKVTVELVRKALRKMKPKKSDALFDSISDLYINGPEELAVHLANLVKLYLVHGYVLIQSCYVRLFLL